MAKYSEEGNQMLKNMIALRREAKITQLEIAKFLGITKTSVHNFESGKTDITLKRYEQVMSYIIGRIN